MFGLKLSLNSDCNCVVFPEQVPAAVSHSEFWHRYFYKLYQFDQVSSHGKFNPQSPLLSLCCGLLVAPEQVEIQTRVEVGLQFILNMKCLLHTVILCFW